MMGLVIKLKNLARQWSTSSASSSKINLTAVFRENVEAVCISITRFSGLILMMTRFKQR